MSAACDGAVIVYLGPPGIPAGPGYDLASRAGTLYVPDFVPELAKLSLTAPPRR